MAGRGTTVGQLIARLLAESGVEWAFTVPGESFLGVLDALPGAGIRVVATRHENGAAFMAEAIGQLTGKPAAVLGTRAVGAANMAIGIHTATQNSTPLVALVGQVRRSFRGREAFQEVDQPGSFGRLTKWAAEIDDPATAGATVAAGLRTMRSGRPGPILLSLPEDVLDLPVPEGGVQAAAAAPPPAPATAPDSDAVAAVLDGLMSARRPAILAGYGVIAARAVDSLVELSERLAVPVFASWRRPTAFPNEHPNFLGTTGYGSPAGVRDRVAAADFLLVIGCRLNEITTFDYQLPAEHTRWAHVDLAPRTAHAGLSAPDVPIAADAAAFLAGALAMIPASHRPEPERVAALAAERATYLASTTTPDHTPWNGPGVDPARMVAMLHEILPDDALLTTDAGNFANWVARGFRFGRANGFLGPTSGAMGYGLPAAIAASLCQPGRTVVAVCGDGGLAMTMNELETAVREGARPIVLVFDNQRYGTIAMHQRAEGRDLVAVDLGAIDFAAVARACGALGFRVEDDGDFEPALVAALEANRPAVIQLDLDRGWISPDRFDAGA